MSEESSGDLSLGLSPEEKADLEELIVASRSDSAKQLTHKQVLIEMDVLKGRVGHLAGRLLELDQRLDRLFEIVRLSHEKSELLCSRIEEAFPVPEERGYKSD